MENLTRTMLSIGLAAAALAASGCVVAIGNRPTDSDDASRIRLSSDEVAGVPVVESALEVPSFDEAYGRELAQLSPEMTVEEFRKLFPDARFVERTVVDGAPVDAWSVVHKQLYRYDSDRRYGYIKRDERWFYFRNGSFVKWGKARDWPRTD